MRPGADRDGEQQPVGPHDRGRFAVDGCRPPGEPRLADHQQGRTLRLDVDGKRLGPGSGEGRFAGGAGGGHRRARSAFAVDEGRALRIER